MKSILLFCLALALLLIGCETTDHSQHGHQNLTSTQLENPVFSKVEVPAEVLKEVALRDQGKCVKCGTAKDLGYAHKVHPDDGGKNTKENLMTVCKSCYGGN
jgi:5-methylcytosine-specific restriction endonuclease McrA